jgi:phage tail-like protein
MPLATSKITDAFDEKMGVALRFDVTMTGFGSIEPTNLKYWTSVKGIDQKFDVIEYRAAEGVNWRTQVPGMAKWSNLTLSRAITHADSKATLKWLKTFADKYEKKGHCSITGYTAWGDKAGVWNFTGVWPLQWDGPQFDTTSTKAATETLTLAHDGLINNPDAAG